MAPASLASDASPMPLLHCRRSEKLHSYDDVASSISAILKDDSNPFCPMEDDVVEEGEGSGSSDSFQTWHSASALLSLRSPTGSSSKSVTTFNNMNPMTKKSISAWELLLGSKTMKMPLHDIPSCRTRITALQHLLGVELNRQRVAKVAIKKRATKGRSLRKCKPTKPFDETSNSSAQRRRPKRPSTAKQDGPKPQCPKCFELFANSRTLKRHSRMHLESTTNFTCNFCSQEFDDKAACLQHRETHLRQAKPYLCVQCKKSFESKKALNMHARSHDLVTATMKRAM